MHRDQLKRLNTFSLTRLDKSKTSLFQQLFSNLKDDKVY